MCNTTKNLVKKLITAGHSDLAKEVLRTEVLHTDVLRAEVLSAIVEPELLGDLLEIRDILYGILNMVNKKKQLEYFDDLKNTIKEFFKQHENLSSEVEKDVKDSKLVAQKYLMDLDRLDKEYLSNIRALRNI